MKLDMRREVLKALKCESVYAAGEAERYERIRDFIIRGGSSTSWKLRDARSKATRYRNRVKALLLLRKEFIALIDGPKPRRKPYRLDRRRVVSKIRSGLDALGRARPAEYSERARPKASR